MATRRFVVGGMAAGAALGAAAIYRCAQRGVFAGGEGPAYRPWADWDGTAADGPARPLRAAILAANAHDTQPWLFAARSAGIDVFADRRRHLGSFDPFRREMHLSLGAAIENLALAACAHGFSAEMQPSQGRLSLSLPDTPFHAAHVQLAPAARQRDRLFDSLPHRHTHRGAYASATKIPLSTLGTVIRTAENEHARIVVFQNQPQRDRLARLVVAATERIIADRQMAQDSAHWFRTGARDISIHRDGVTLDTSGLSPAMVMLAKFLPDLDAETSDRYWLGMTRDLHVATAPVLGMILVRDRFDMAGALYAGRAWQRLHLAATAEGLAAQPLNQPVECIDRAAMTSKPDKFRSAMQDLAGTRDWEATFIFRLGVPLAPAGPSPRRPLRAVLI